MAGSDYDFNYSQGLVILTTPLSGSGSSGGLVSGGSAHTYLMANYEHTPTTTATGTFSFGGRVQGWLTDSVRVGATASSENLGTSRQDAQAVDLRFQFAEHTYAELEYAQTNGTGGSGDLSLDGGLTFTTNPGVTGSGTATRFAGQMDLQDVGLGADGLISGYFEQRSAGFSAQGHQATNDETLWGIKGEFSTGTRSELAFHYDSFDEVGGKSSQKSGVEFTFEQNNRLTWQIGTEDLQQNTPGVATETGSRTDVAVRLTYGLDDDREIYGFAQQTVRLTGGLTRNDRYGFGGSTRLNDAWKLSGELSTGTTGFGGKILANYDRGAGNSLYFGFTLDPDRTLDGITLSGRDEGAFVVGGRRRVNDSLTMFGENTYDMFGQHRALTSTYGAEYTLNNSMTINGNVEFGRVSDANVGTDLDRIALSFGTHYNTENLVVKSRVELRRDRGVNAGTNNDADTIAGTLSARYTLSDQARLLFSAEGVTSINAAASIPDAKFFEGSLGYAFRPISNDRLNVLAKYNYLYDMTARIGTLTASGAAFATSPRQKSHILSVDASYDINNHLTVGGKIGGRWSSQDTGAGFSQNNATLTVVNLRAHVVHNWDALLEFRMLNAQDIGADTGIVAGAYRHFGNNLKVGLGYNFGNFSDDLRDVTYDDSGIFLNVVGKF